MRTTSTSAVRASREAIFKLLRGVDELVWQERCSIKPAASVRALYWLYTGEAMRAIDVLRDHTRSNDDDFPIEPAISVFPWEGHLSGEETLIQIDALFERCPLRLCTEDRSIVLLLVGVSDGVTRRSPFRLCSMTRITPKQAAAGKL